MSWMRLAGFVFFVAGCLAAALASAADRVDSRYGEVTLARGDEATFVVSLNARPLTKVAASAASLYRVTPHGDSEYFLVELWEPGLNCHHSYLVIAVRAAGEVQRSPVFGECTDLIAVSHVRGGVRVELRPVVKRGGSGTVPERYLVSGGKVTRQRVPLSTARR